MATGRRAPNADPRRVEAVLGGVRTQPVDRRPAIFDLRGIFRLRTESIADARHRVPASGHRLGGVLVIRAVVPAPAVNPDDQWDGRLPRRGRGR